MVLLFDVDGTLVTTGGAGRRALERIFEVVYGRDDACAFPLDGMTDRAIVRAALRSIGRDAEEAEINAILVRYLEILADEVAGVASDKYRIHRGIEPALEAAAACPNVALGLGTGPIRYERSQGGRSNLCVCRSERAGSAGRLAQLSNQHGFEACVVRARNALRSAD
jgi:beta-phosphoglucomutase-like phosphatase (HAD superfamily)